MQSPSKRPTRSHAHAWAYTAIIFVVIVMAGAYAARKRGVFACSASGYDTDRYLAYCQAVNYGDYDHGAFWFGLEPAATEAATRADVVFLGNSRLQFAMSTETTAAWFSAADARYYLLGFSYNGNYLFEQPLLDRLKVRAKVYVINLDLFFEDVESPPARAVMRDSAARARHEQKRQWQTLHRAACVSLPPLCGNARAFFRTRSTGAWEWQGGGVTPTGVAYDESVDPTVVRNYRDLGSGFLSALAVPRECIVATAVPTIPTNVGTARAVAQGLGVDFVAPQLDGLHTFDESHLDAASAQRWSQAFLEEAGPTIRTCLASPNGYAALAGTATPRGQR
jgi:hypothetical protein